MKFRLLERLQYECPAVQIVTVPTGNMKATLGNVPPLVAGQLFR